MKHNQTYTGLEIAIIGMACRYPGADNWREYWKNLVNGVESIQFFSKEELLSGGEEEEIISKENYVNAAAKVNGKALFDHNFFEYSQQEATLMNPVHRVFHQTAWEALEDAGYHPDVLKGQIGVYAGAGDDLNWKAYSLLENMDQEEVDGFMLDLINSKDHLATLLAYKLNLKGPAFGVSTACSTSLTAVNQACKSLLLGEAKLALAGGISLGTGKNKGYFHEEGLIHSSDGHCRAFDASSSGTVAAEGVGIVVLKRLTEAINDGDHIYAVIKGTAINNDGNRKVGYTAPSIEGQTECIRKAHAFAKVDPASISYVEAHGTGTRLGDPIEIEALNQAFQKSNNRHCAIGSVKTNIGHADAAAGVAGLIKTALSLQYKQLPPSLHFVTPNPEIDFAGGPFKVNATLTPWVAADDQPLRAGVSSFGIGGTNVHAVLEEAPATAPSAPGRSRNFLALSAKTEGSLLRYMEKLRGFLDDHPDSNLADVAYTLHTGRKSFTRRRSIPFGTREELLAALDPANLKEQIVKAKDKTPGVVFLFSGQGAQYANMAKDLYDNEPLYKEEINKGLALLEQLSGQPFRKVLFPGEGEDTKAINETHFTQPLIFLTSYALARLLMSYGITPKYMIGHSIGEYTAACISGVLSFEDAAKLLVTRGALMSQVPRGEMLSVPIAETEAMPYLGNDLFLAAVNGPEQVVFSGTPEAIAILKAKLDDQGTPYVPLHTSHAFHSGMQDPILPQYREALQACTFNEPQLPYLSNLTGEMIQSAQARDADYWVRHLRETVRFSDGLKTLLAQNNDLVCIEVGPGQSLSSLLRQQPAKVMPISVNLIRPVKEKENDYAYFIARMGQLWVRGIEPDWKAWYKGETRKRLSLPTYAFDPNVFPAEVDPYKTKPLSGGDADETAKVQKKETKKEAPTSVAEVVPDLADIDLDAIEDTEAGKVAIVKQERPDLMSEYVPPNTGTEKKLANIFENFFAIENIGIEDNFFELGGDSLKGMVVLKRIKTEFDINIALKDFFGKQTIKEIAVEIDEIRSLLEKKSDAPKKTIKI
jgi:phthiocerol/phenolphthiocerol synthesis type-I polyketide synthase E